MKSSNREGAGWVMGTFLLVNTALGAGLLNYPSAYDRLGGITLATIFQVILILLMSTTMIVLAYCADLTGVYTYHDVLEQMCGPFVRKLAALSILISCFGICVTFLIIIGDQFDRIFASFFGDHFCHDWYMSRVFTIIITTIITIWPMTYCRRLEFLKHANMLGVFITFYIIFLNIYKFYEMDANRGEIKNYPDDIIALMAALPIVCFAFQSHEVVVPVYECLKERNPRNFTRITICTLLTLFLIYCMSGTYGYLTFGSLVAPDIMLMYSPKDPIVCIAVIVLIIKMITTYPSLTFSGRDTFVGLFCKIPDKLLTKEEFDKREFRQRVIITTVWNCIGLVMAVVIPDIAIALGFLGSLAACNVFLFPGLCMTALARRLMDNTNKQDNFLKRNFKKILFIYGIFIIMIAVLMFVIILYQVVKDFTSEDKHEHLCK